MNTVIEMNTNETIKEYFTNILSKIEYVNGKEKVQNYPISVPSNTIKTIHRMAIERVNMCFAGEITANDILYSTSDWILFVLEKISNSKLQKEKKVKKNYSRFEENSIEKEIDLSFQQILNVETQSNKNYYYLPDKIFSTIKTNITEKEQTTNIDYHKYVVDFFQTVINILDKHSISIVSDDFSSADTTSLKDNILNEIFIIKEPHSTDKVIENKKDITPIKEEFNKNNKNIVEDIALLQSQLKETDISEENINKIKSILITMLYDLDQKK